MQLVGGNCRTADASGLTQKGGALMAPPFDWLGFLRQSGTDSSGWQGYAPMPEVFHRD